MSVVSTDEMYNASSRALHGKFIIYFAEPLVVTKENYLTSASILEESLSLTDSPFGVVTSNELSLSIYNDNGMFNPQNTASPYYGSIKKGLKIEAFIRPDEADVWDQLGVFYVTDWSTSVGGALAEVTANDALYNVLNSAVPDMPVYRSETLASFASEYFGRFGQTVSVAADVRVTVPYIYTSGYSSNKTFLSDLMNATLCHCFCDHDGSIKIQNRLKSSSVRATLTDTDQVISVSVKQAITGNYDSVRVQCNTPQESAEDSLLSVSEVNLVPGLNILDRTEMSKKQVLSIRSVRTQCAEPIEIVNFSATASDFSCHIRSTSDVSASLDVVGTSLETLTSSLGTPAESTLEVSNAFIQTTPTANRVLTYGKKFVDAVVPTVELAVRGNPKLLIGDKIRVNSSYYKTDFTGRITKAQYDYVGGLTCSLTLIIDIEEV